MGSVESFDYDCIAEVLFRDQEHFDAVQVRMKEFEEVIREDEESFLNRDRVTIVKVDEPIVTMGGGSDGSMP